MSKRENSFKFSHDKYFRAVTFDEFRETVKDIDGIVRSNNKRIESVILTCEDFETYQYSTVTFISDEIGEVLKRRKEYLIDEFNQEVWDKSYRVSVWMGDQGESPSFAVRLTVDRTADAKRLIFSGYSLDDNTHDRITEKYRRFGGFSYRLGNGMGKISDFNFNMGMKLTGINLSR